MNKTLKTLLLLVSFIGIIILSVSLYNYLSDNYSPKDDTFDSAQENDSLQTAPDFAVLDINGNTVNLHDYFGKPIVLNFWATWCGPCNSEMPYFNNLYEKYKNDVTFLMVNLTDGKRDTIDSVKDFLDDNGYTFPVYFDEDDSASDAYGVNSIPMSVFINEKGLIIDYHIGAVNENNLQKYIKKIM